MKEDIIRISSGVTGIDGMLEGGIPQNSITCVSGPAGVGKSIFALQFAFAGAKMGVKSLYLNLEEPLENIKKTISQLSFGREFLSLEKKGLISIVCLSYSEFEKVYPDLFKNIEKDRSIKRLVIDSFNCFFSYLKLEKSISESSGYEIRRILSQSFSLFRKRDFTTLLVLENGSSYNSDLNHYVEYMADGMIHFDYMSLGTIERRVFIPKMRWTSQYGSSLMFDISKKGISIHTEEN
jgi:KaiC/GvpD/RAD55 family RecA-like ATPase